MNEYRTRLSENGRILIPASMRKKLKFAPGQKLLVRLINGHLEIFTTLQGVEMAQSLVKSFLKSETSLTRELIDERREDVEND